MTDSATDNDNAVATSEPLYPCPRCDGQTIAYHVDYKNTWAVCEACQVRFWAGHGITTPPDDITVADYERNREELLRFPPESPEDADLNGCGPLGRLLRGPEQATFCTDDIPF